MPKNKTCHHITLLTMTTNANVTVLLHNLLHMGQTRAPQPTY